MAIHAPDVATDDWKPNVPGKVRVEVSKDSFAFFFFFFPFISLFQIGESILFNAVSQNQALPPTICTYHSAPTYPFATATMAIMSLPMKVAITACQTERPAATKEAPSCQFERHI